MSYFLYFGIRVIELGKKKKKDSMLQTHRPRAQILVVIVTRK